MGTKIKAWADAFLADWGLVLIIVVAALASFALGRLSALEEARPLVQITSAAQNASPTALIQGGMVIASRSGTTYYYPWCSGAEKILPANQRVFLSEATAAAAGFHPAKNCKGLE